MKAHIQGLPLKSDKMSAKDKRNVSKLVHKVLLKTLLSHGICEQSETSLHRKENKSNENIGSL